MRNILVITLGGAPGVVTETIWWLLRKREVPWPPDELHLVTTTFGAKDWRPPTTDARKKLSALLRHCERPEIRPDVHVPKDQYGEEIDDIRTEAENVAFANDLTRLIKRLSDSANNCIHVSMSGGRKTMSSYAQQAISLCGRDGDELSHILVNPPALEYNRAFFWPGQEAQQINIGTAQQPEMFEVANAEIELVPSPFVRLRTLLKHIPLAQENFDHWTLVERAQAGVDEFALELDIANRAVKVGGESVKFSAQEFALYRVLVTALKESWPGYGPEGAGANHRGWIALPDFEHPASTAFKAYFDYYSACFPGDPDQHFWNFKKDIEGHLSSGSASGIDYARNRFKGLRRAIKERIEKSLSTFSKKNRIMPHSVKVPAQDRRKHLSRYGLPFEPHEIEINEGGHRPIQQSLDGRTDG